MAPLHFCAVCGISGGAIVHFATNAGATMIVTSPLTIACWRFSRSYSYLESSLKALITARRPGRGQTTLNSCESTDFYFVHSGNIATLKIHTEVQEHQTSTSFERISQPSSLQTSSLNQLNTSASLIFGSVIKASDMLGILRQFLCIVG